jgi:hypothetical protein
MRWPPVYWIFAALLISGCGGQRVGFDPFGRTTIPPPPTAMRSANADPYYSGVMSTAPPPLVALPQGTTVSPPASLAAAPPMYSTRGWRAAGAPAAESAVAASPPPGRLRPVPTYLDNRANTSSVTLTAGNPAAWTATDNGTADFQEAVGGNVSTANSALQPYLARYGGDVSQGYDPLAPQSASFGGATTTRQEPGIDAASRPYGHASDFTWLKGKLEYVAGQRQWKLRYAPVDEEPDAFGGSVVLSAFSELENYRSGDLVIVHGRPAEPRWDGRQDGQAFAVMRLERQ